MFQRAHVTPRWLSIFHMQLKMSVLSSQLPAPVSRPVCGHASHRDVSRLLFPWNCNPHPDSFFYKLPSLVMVFYQRNRKVRQREKETPGKNSF